VAPRDARGGDHGKIINRGTPIEKEPQFVKIVDRPQERGRAILASRLDFRTAFEQDAHHLPIRVQGRTHERGVTRFVASVGIRSLLD
jgi:hypothetical protein